MSFGAHRPMRLLLERMLLALVCLLLGVAVFAPSLTVNRSVYDVLVVVDITQSMNVPDYRLHGTPVSRLVFAKHALQDALWELPCGSRLGLAVFTEYRAFVLFAPVEVCRHRVELADAIGGLSGQMAWANASEIAKGVHFGIQAAKSLPEKPALIFLTDGHEAPPIEAQHRPRFDGEAGEVRGALVGVGGLKPLPIPKIDPDGLSAGYWSADEVAQTDPYSRGRAGSLAHEPMTETGPPGEPLPQDQPRGEEELSALHERYLQLLARETGLRYRRLVDPASLLAALEDPSLARHVTAPTEMRWIPAALALGILVVVCLPRRTPLSGRLPSNPSRARAPGELTAEARGWRTMRARRGTP